MKKTLYFLIIALSWVNFLKAQWFQLAPPFQGYFTSVSFPDTNIGYVSGSNYSDNKGIIIKTSNGGTDWSLVCYDTASSILTSVFFVNADTGYAAGYFGSMTNTILKTVDGGNSWIRQYYTNSAKGFTSIYFINADTGYIVGNSIILKTINGGASWINQSTGISNILTSVYFSNSDTGYAVGDFGAIMKTTDGGSNWESTPISIGWGDLSSVYFINSDTGYIVGFGETGPTTGFPLIYKTNDGGLTNISQASMSPYVLYSVYFLDANIGYIVGAGGKIQMTTNCGSTWTSQTSGTSQPLFSVQFTDTVTGYIVGNNTLLKTINGGLTFIEENESHKSIYNIFPNPANNKITIAINEELYEEFVISIFNIRGEQVIYEKLQNQKQIGIDISLFEKGIYLVKILTNEGFWIKKLILD